MKFFSIFTPDPKAADLRPNKDRMAEMGRLIDESRKAGGLVATGGLMPLSKGGAVVRRSGDETRVLDGPFTESKELVAGWAVLEASSTEEAVEMTKRFMAIAGDGESELRVMMEG
jgi:hypothetical protein